MKGTGTDSRTYLGAQSYQNESAKKIVRAGELGKGDNNVNTIDEMREKRYEAFVRSSLRLRKQFQINL